MANNIQIQPTSIRWNSLAKDSAIKVWSEDLKRVCKTDKDWDIVGHGVVIEALDEDIVIELIQHLTAEASISMQIISANCVIEAFPKFLDALSKAVPTMLYLKAGAWQGGKFSEFNPEADAPNCDPEILHEFITSLLKSFNNDFLGQQIVLVTTVKNFEQLDIKLRVSGGFDRRIQMPRFSNDAIFRIFVEEIGMDILGESISKQIIKVGSLLKDSFPDTRRRRLMQKALQRLSWRENRVLEYVDLVKFACYGTGEVDSILHDLKDRRRNAIHEAGHVVVGHVGSRDKTPPSYCSIIPRDDIGGIVVTAYESHERSGNDTSYNDAAHQVRTLLSGRAAEHLLLGSGEFSAIGASSDLAKATEIANSMFTLWGLSDDNSSFDSSSKNLVTVFIDPSPSGTAYVEEMMRRFMQKMYLETIEILELNSDYLNKIVSVLLEKNILVQDEIQLIYENVTN